MARPRKPPLQEGVRPKLTEVERAFVELEFVQWNKQELFHQEKPQLSGEQMATKLAKRDIKLTGSRINQMRKDPKIQQALAQRISDYLSQRMEERDADRQMKP